MALEAGTVTVASDATYTGTGIALALMTSKVSSLDRALADPLPAAQRVKVLKALALDAADEAAVLVEAIKMADVRVFAGAIDGAPAAEVLLTGAIQ